MDIDELKSIIRREIDTSLGIEGSRLSADRRKALEYYDGEPLGNEVEGQSSVVMLSVLETVEWILPALLRIFCSSDQLAEYEPAHGSQDPQQQALNEQAAKQATEYLQHIVYKDNAGFIALHDWFKDALLQKVGWIKVFWDTERYLETNTYRGLNREQYEALIADPAATVIEKREYPAPMPGGFNQDAPNAP